MLELDRIDDMFVKLGLFKEHLSRLHAPFEKITLYPVHWYGQAEVAAWTQ